ncbi:MAG: hypothetical protein GF331_06000, partial [Chitinivibrionales bacterium]|nr:hypothetical protein [Chitinivibrionales bacterium]
MRTPDRTLLTTLAVLILAADTHSQDFPQMPMGMNTGWNSYGDSECPFIDLMKSSDRFMGEIQSDRTSHSAVDRMECDSNGYPLWLPQNVDGVDQFVSFLINNRAPYAGRYVFLYDGEGTFDWGTLDHEYTGGKHYITVSGTGGHRWMYIKTSVQGNHIRNIRMIPEDMEATYDPAYPFRQEYLDFLRPFQVVRVRALMGIDDGYNVLHWEDRATPSYYTQDTWYKGVAIEHCIQLCNELDADMWFCVPHPVWDDWIWEAARLVRDSLKPCLNVYLEYSNELWNWASGFPQSHWVGNNGRDPGHPEWDCHDSIYTALRAIGQEYCGDPDNYCHPEKDAYMMARTFRIWKSVFEETGARDRLILTAGIQGFWNATTERVLSYLFNDDGIGCDIVSPASYFSISGEARSHFDGLPVGQVTTQMIYDSAVAAMDRSFTTPGEGALELRELMRQYGVGVANYEGGTHIYDYQEHHWDDSLEAMHGSPLIYELYRRMNRYWRDTLGSQANVLLSTIGENYLDFAHITDWNQVYLPRDQMMQQAPKYLAAVDGSLPKRECGSSSTPRLAAPAAVPRPTCLLRSGRVLLTAREAGDVHVRVCALDGRTAVLLRRKVTAGEDVEIALGGYMDAQGLYLVSVKQGGHSFSLRYNTLS